VDGKVLLQECERVLTEHRKGTAVYRTQDYAASALAGLAALLPHLPVSHDVAVAKLLS
jgi:hypothetical protein